MQNVFASMLQESTQSNLDQSSLCINLKPGFPLIEE
jgi:hypothetical protein